MMLVQYQKLTKLKLYKLINYKENAHAPVIAGNAKQEFNTKTAANSGIF